MAFDKPANPCDIGKIMSKISEFTAMPKMAPYKRKDGTTWGKLNEQFHVKVVVKPGGSISGDGTAEKLDPNEIVDRFQA